MRSAKLLFCFGTRPEAIKMAPMIRVLDEHEALGACVCVTAQHREMLDQMLEVFQVRPDYDLDLMSPNQNLSVVTNKIVGGISGVLDIEKPDLVVVQGDTATTFAAALASFYCQVPVAHLEAGLRTFDKFAPFPEEMYRQLTTRLTDWHYPPTQRAANALVAEGIHEDRILVVGNTVIDAIVGILHQVRQRGFLSSTVLADCIMSKRFVLVTGHRRENFGAGFQSICTAISRLSSANPEVHFVYPVHLNPNVQKPVRKILGNRPNVHLLDPLPYLDFVWLMDRCHLVLTDSGGVQEEAPSLGKPVFVMRDKTERQEAIDAGVAKLVGTERDVIISEVQHILDSPSRYEAMSQAHNPYGDGKAALKVADHLKDLWLSRKDFRSTATK